MQSVVFGNLFLPSRDDFEETKFIRRRLFIDLLNDFTKFQMICFRFHSSWSFSMFLEWWKLYPIDKKLICIVDFYHLGFIFLVVCFFFWFLVNICWYGIIWWRWRCFQLRCSSKNECIHFQMQIFFLRIQKNGCFDLYSRVRQKRAEIQSPWLQKLMPK